MAFDSARKMPGSISSTGIRPFGFFARNAGVRDSPFRMSTSMRSNGMPSWVSSSRTLYAFPDDR